MTELQKLLKHSWFSQAGRVDDLGYIPVRCSCGTVRRVQTDRVLEHSCPKCGLHVKKPPERVYKRYTTQTIRRNLSANWLDYHDRVMPQGDVHVSCKNGHHFNLAPRFASIITYCPICHPVKPIEAP